MKTHSLQDRRSFLRRAALTGVGAPWLVAIATDSAKTDARAGDARVIDFHRSFVRWTLDTKLKPPKTVSRPLPMTLNRVRMPIEAVAMLTNQTTGERWRYVLGAECRTEQVWVKRDVWHDPNASMCVIAGEKHWVIEKHWARADYEATLYPPKLGAQPERQLVDSHDAFAEAAIDVAQVRAVELADTDAIMAALAGRTTLVARTEYAASGYAVALEYPVKTSNYSERERYYQVDTGPVLFPGVTGIGAEGANPILSCRLAFVAHNEPGWAEFLVCVPTPVAENLRVHHYSQSVRVENAHNRLFRVG